MSIVLATDRPEEIQPPVQESGEFFISPQKQLAIIRRLNHQRGWGFSESDFNLLGKPPPWPENFCAAVILDASLDTAWRTFHEALEFAEQNISQPYAYYKKGLEFSLYEEIRHHRGLRWRVVDLSANQGLAPATVHDPNNSPHSAILWAVGFFPNWVRLIHPRRKTPGTFPGVWLPGYRFRLGRKSLVPNLDRIVRFDGLRPDDLLVAGLDEGNRAIENLAVPEFIIL